MPDDDERPDGLVGVADAIELLRAELQEARRAGKDEEVAFDVGPVQLTLTTVLSAGGTVGGKVRWWLVEAGAEGTRSTEATQTIELTLSPVTRNPDGTSTSMQVGDNDQPEPPG